MAKGPVVDLELPYCMRHLDRPSRYKASYGGRGGTKSHSFASKLILLGNQRPLRVLCCREIQRSISASVKRLLDDKIAKARLEGFYKSTQYGITAPNGTEFLFAGLRTNPDSIKSMEGIDIAWVEEANTVSQSSLDLLIPTIRNDNSEIWFSWNRRYDTDPVDKMFLGKDGPPPGAMVWKVGWQDNPWFPDVLRAEMEWDKSRDMDKYLHIWEGELLKRSESRVFKNWTVDDLDDTGILNTVPRLGADWGFANDPTVLIEAYIMGRTLYFRREVWKIGCEIDETPSLFAGTDWHEKKRWENTHGHKGVNILRGTPHRIVADSARPETISYMKKRGFNMIGAKKGPGSINEGVEFMKSYDIVVHPDCVHVQDELTHYSYKEDPLTGEVLAELADKKNHTIDSCRYALEGVRRVAALQTAAGLGPDGSLGPRVIEG